MLKQNNNPSISIVTVCYNSEKTIAATLSSIKMQTFQDIEHIIIDGKSTDKTLEIINGSKISSTILISEPDEGIYDAMNKGISFARGKIIAILNSDDVFAGDNVLSLINKEFEYSGADIICGGIVYVSEANEKISEWKPKKFSKGSYKYGYHVPHPGFFVKSTIYEKWGNFDTNLKIAADFDLMYRFMERKDTQVQCLQDVVVHMRADGESADLKNIMVGLSDILRSFRKAGEFYFLPVMLICRYLPKMSRKLKTIILK